MNSFFRSILRFFKSLLHIIWAVLLFALLICAVVFLVDNREMVTIHFHPLPFEISARLFIIMAACFIFGLLFSAALFSTKLIKSSLKNSRNKRKIKKLESNLMPNPTLDEKP